MDVPKAEKIVDKLIEDLTDRSGLQNEWDALDEETQAEIRGAWRDIILRWGK